MARLTAVSRRGVLTPALPVPSPALANAGLHLRGDQLSLTVAAPGVGKSQLWLNLAVRTPVPSIYWSADTDSHDVLLRAQALLSGHPALDVERARELPQYAPFYAERLQAAAHVEWVFESMVTARGVAERMNAFGEIHGEYPKLVVVDNLSNTVGSQGDELQEQRAFIREMQDLARESHAHIAVLAHAKGAYDNGNIPIPLGGVYNNLGKVPSVVLTLHWADDSQEFLNVNPVKNRGGQPDPAARNPIQFRVDYSRATVYGIGAAA